MGINIKSFLVSLKNKYGDTITLDEFKIHTESMFEGEKHDNSK